MIAVVSAIIMCFALAGCSKDVKGNTYVFDDIIVEGTIPDEYKDEMDAMIAGMKEGMAGVSYKFNDDGTVTVTWGESGGDTGYYKQDGKKVYIAETKEDLDNVDGEDSNVETYEVDGSKLIATESEGGMTMKMVFKKK